MLLQYSVRAFSTRFASRSFRATATEYPRTIRPETNSIGALRAGKRITPQFSGRTRRPPARRARISSLSRRQTAALTGVAPFNRDSGNFHGKRRIRGGRAHSRTALFLSAMVAIRYNPDIKRFYERLLQTSKHKKVALTACIRKIVTALNAMLRDNKPWETSLA